MQFEIARVSYHHKNATNPVNVQGFSPLSMMFKAVQRMLILRRQLSDSEMVNGNVCITLASHY